MNFRSEIFLEYIYISLEKMRKYNIKDMLFFITQYKGYFLEYGGGRKRKKGHGRIFRVSRRKILHKWRLARMDPLLTKLR